MNMYILHIIYDTELSQDTHIPHHFSPRMHAFQHNLETRTAFACSLDAPLHAPIPLFILQAITRVIEAQDQLVESAKLGTPNTSSGKS